MQLTKEKIIQYNKGEPVRCDCGWIIAFYKDGNLILYCKKCKRQIPFKIKIEPEP